MSGLADFLKENMEKAYAFATANTKVDADGKAVVSKDDEWKTEHEWDSLYKELMGEKK